MKAAASSSAPTRTGRLVPLGAYIEELYRVSGLPVAQPTQPCLVPDPLPADGAGPYLALERSHRDDSQGNPLFDMPFFSVPLPDDGACVSDFGHHRVCVVAAAGGVECIGRHGATLGEFNHPQGLALNSDGSLLVADGAGRVQALDDEGNGIRSFGEGSAPRAAAAAAASGRLAQVWVPHRRAGSLAQTTTSTIQPGDLSTPNPTALPSLGALQPCSGAADDDQDPGQLQQPCGLALGPDGRVYVSDKAGNRVLCFRRDGEFAFAFGSRGSALGELRDPRGLAVHAGQVWVADMCNHRLSIFSLRGRPLRHIGRFGSGPAEFQHPVGVAHSMDLLLVSEYTGARIQVLTPTGAALQVIRAPFAGAYLGALGANAGRVTVTDNQSKLHCLRVLRRGTEGAREPLPGREEEDGGPFALAAVHDPARDHAARTRRLKRTRAGRVELALAAADYREVLASLTRDDMAALVPVADEHAAKHPEGCKSSRTFLAILHTFPQVAA